MSLIKSKQIESLGALKVVETTDKQFVSTTDKTNFSDKYTKSEIDGQVSTISTNISTVQTNLEGSISTLQTNLQNQISNAVAGISWKSPVANFAAIATTYPNPLEGWVVTVDDTNKIFRYDSETTSWVDFPIQLPTTYVKTVAIIPATNNITSINTKIRNDNTGIYKTGHSEIILAVNGFIQVPGSDKDYTAAFVNNELIITWNNRNFSLDTSDELDITYTHFDVV